MTTTPVPASRDEALRLDAADPLAPLRSQFELPEETIYLVGHSLGPASRPALAAARQAMERDWAEGLVRSWNTAGWIDLPQKVGARLAPLIGVKASEVVVCDSVSVNLFKLAAAALPLVRTPRIVVEADEFPTDRFIAEGLAGIAGAVCVRAAPGEGIALLEGGVMVKSAVGFRSAEIADVAGLEAEAKACGGMIVWDLSHASGVVPLSLGADGARLAAGCTYKYLNGGPGAPAFLYAAEGLAEELVTPLPGWLGHARPFAFAPDYEPAEGVLRFVAGTPSILSMAALDGALEVFEGVDPRALWDKARTLGDLVLARAGGLGLETAVPEDRALRGGHVSLKHPGGYAVVQALASRGILADFRTPDTIRFGLSPLFLRHVDVWDTMKTLGEILEGRLWDDPRFKVQAKVT